MPSNLRRADIIRALTTAGVPFDPEATLVQLRPLYEASLNQQQQPENEQSDEEREPDEENNPDEEQQLEVYQQNPDEEQQQKTEVCQQQQQQPVVYQEKLSAVTQVQCPEIHQQPIKSTVQPQCQRPDIKPVESREMQDFDLRSVEAELDRQIAVLHKKRELIHLQQELYGVGNKSIDLGMLDAMIEKFNGSELQDVTKWLENLENVFEIFHYNERDKLVATRHLMTDHAKRFVDIVRAHSFDELKEALLTEFRRVFSVQDVLRQLRARMIQPQETPRQYALEMQYMASRANVSEDDLVDIIIEGLNDRTPLVSMLYHANSLRELKILLERYEKKRRALTPLSAKTDATSKHKQGIANSAALQTTGHANSVQESPVRCYNCFKYGHYQSACPAPRRPPNSCFICHDIGHTRHQCPQKKKTEETQTTSVASAEIGGYRSSKELSSSNMPH